MGSPTSRTHLVKIGILVLVGVGLGVTTLTNGIVASIAVCMAVAVWGVGGVGMRWVLAVTV